MAENQDGLEKSERPSSRRLEQAREKGQVPSTRELSPVVMLFGAVGLFALWAPMALQNLHSQSRHWFETAGARILTPETAYSTLLEVVHGSLLPLLPFAVILAALGVLATVVQTGPLWVSDAIQMKLSKLNPVNGLKRMISLRGFVELWKSLLKLGLATGVTSLILADRIAQIVAFPSMDLVDSLAVTGDITMTLVLWIGLTFLVLALADFGYQKWQFLRDQRMTRQEVKDETKDTEGNPLIKSRRLSLQRERARQRMMQAVPKADVVITNPTHLAVALKYDPDESDAPTVVAKGAGFVAERIRQIARHAGVPIIENKALAQSLYKVVAVGKTIPVNLYKAVAEVLAYVYRLKQERSG